MTRVRLFFVGLAWAAVAATTVGGERAGKDAAADDDDRLGPPVLRDYKEVIAAADAVLRGINPALSKHPGREAINKRYSLVRYMRGHREYAADGRPVYLARVTVDKWTGELIELRGDYSDDEVDLIERYRPPGVMTPEQAIELVIGHVQRVGSKLSPGRRPSASDIDLVAKRYYVVRFVNPKRVPKGVMSTAPYYSSRIVVDGVTGKVLSHSLG